MWASRQWKYEFWLVLIALLLLAIVGSVIGSFLELVAIGLLCYLVWHLLQLSKLFHWLFVSKAFFPPTSVGIWGDIFNRFYSKEKKNRSERKKLQDIISEFRASTRALKDGVLIISDQGEIRWFNKAAAGLLGLKAGSDIGQRLFNLLRHPSFIEYEKARDYDKPLEIHSPADDNLIINIQITPYNEDQRLVMIRDITDRYHLEHVRQDFVANVSHELKTPLTVITGYLEMLDPEMNPNLSSVAKPLAMMRQQALNMGHLVDDLLLLSRLDSKVESKTHKNIDINLLLDTICAEARALSADKDHRILFHSHSNSSILGAEKQLRSAFSNLVFNAVRYTPKGGQIDIFWQENDTHLIMKVVDNGPGIAEHHIPRLTERFYRVDSARNRSQGGTGLGLAIVKHVLEHHQAELQVESTLDKGSTFSCVFPKDDL